MLNHLTSGKENSEASERFVRLWQKLVLTSDNHGGPGVRAMLLFGLLLCSMLCGFNAGIVQLKKISRAVVYVGASVCLDATLPILVMFHESRLQTSFISLGFRGGSSHHGTRMYHYPATFHSPPPTFCISSHL